MRQYLEALKEIKPLINDGESYIIFNDGKAVDCNIEDGVEITVDDPYDFSSYGYPASKEQKAISKKAPLTTLISFSKSLNVKIIHICDDVNYINYQLEVMPRCNVEVTNLYLHIVSESKIVFNTIVHHKSTLKYLEVNKFGSNVTKYTNFYLSHTTDVSVKNLYLNSKESHDYFTVHMLAEKANVDVLNVCVSSFGANAEEVININHHDEETKSNFTAYGISKDASSIFFNNNGTIDNGAHKAELRQKTKGIILDSDSTIKALPALFIDEDDVIANHGASVGSINEDDLYYLMSRGLCKEDAEKLIINAFIEPFFKDSKEDKTIDTIRGYISSLL